MVRITEGEGALIRAGPHSTVKKYASLETKRGVSEDHRTKQGWSETFPHTLGRGNMASSIYQKSSKEIRQCMLC